MSKRTRAQRRRARQAKAEQQTAVAAPEPVVAETPPPEPEQPTDDIVSQDEPDLDALINGLQDGEVLVSLTCGAERRLMTFEGKAIAEAAETAAVTFVAAEGSFPSDEIVTHCWTNWGEFGPFPIELALTAHARHLRGDDDE